jgi:hypothetical protein
VGVFALMSQLGLISESENERAFAFLEYELLENLGNVVGLNFC